jgi:hypothetical protein
MHRPVQRKPPPLLDSTAEDRFIDARQGDLAPERPPTTVAKLARLPGRLLSSNAVLSAGGGGEAAPWTLRGTAAGNVAERGQSTIGTSSWWGPPPPGAAMGGRGAQSGNSRVRSIDGVDGLPPRLCCAGGRCVVLRRRSSVSWCTKTSAFVPACRKRREFTSGLQMAQPVVASFSAEGGKAVEAVCPAKYRSVRGCGISGGLECAQLRLSPRSSA